VAVALRHGLSQADDIILVIDEVHTLIGAGAAEGAIDAANILKPALARGELQCIGATTIDEYRKHIEKDPALERRFQPVNVPEPTVEDCIQVSERQSVTLEACISEESNKHHALPPCTVPTNQTHKPTILCSYRSSLSGSVLSRADEWPGGGTAVEQRDVFRGEF
jgi:hypothetical protein